MQEYPITIHQHSGCGLPPRILLQIRILRFFTLRNREEVLTIKITGSDFCTFVELISIIVHVHTMHWFVKELIRQSPTTHIKIATVLKA